MDLFLQDAKTQARLRGLCAALRKKAGQSACSCVGAPIPVSYRRMLLSPGRIRLLAMLLFVMLLATTAVIVRSLRRGGGWGHTLGAATHLTSIDADVFFLNVPELVRRGPPRLVVVRLNAPMVLVPHHYAADELAGPVTIEDWARVLQAPIVFNAGQFDSKLHYLGWLKSRGNWLSQVRKSAWMGLLVSEPQGAQGPTTRVVDLEQAPADVVARYANVMQSMMLVDESAHVRVRHTDLAACRTVVAEDTQGRVLVLATEGAATLYDLANWLPKSGLDIVRAMNLDGGIESQLAINTPELKLTLYGQYGTESTLFEAHAGMVRYPLPAVVAVQPKAAPPP
jgi:hypothetical protein